MPVMKSKDRELAANTLLILNQIYNLNITDSRARSIVNDALNQKGSGAIETKVRNEILKFSEYADMIKNSTPKIANVTPAEIKKISPNVGHSVTPFVLRKKKRQNE